MIVTKKAKELVDTFARIDGYEDSIDLSKCEFEKKCALIAVYEIKEALKQTFNHVHEKTEMTPNLYLSESIAVHYYQEVKQEIEKL